MRDMEAVRRRIIQLMAIGLIALAAPSCTLQDDQYAHYQIINKNGWSESEELFFLIPKRSEEQHYKVTVALRLDRSIKYREIPIGLVIETPSKQVQTEVIKIPTDIPQLKTGGYNLYERKYTLPEIEQSEKGIYSYSLRHLSTDSIIYGVVEIGVIVEPSKHKR